MICAESQHTIFGKARGPRGERAGQRDVGQRLTGEGGSRAEMEAVAVDADAEGDVDADVRMDVEVEAVAVDM